MAEQKSSTKLNTSVLHQAKGSITDLEDWIYLEKQDMKRGHPYQ